MSKNRVLQLPNITQLLLVLLTVILGVEILHTGVVDTNQTDTLQL